MNPKSQESDIGLSAFLAFGTGLLTFLISAWMLVWVALWLGWLEIDICFLGPCRPANHANEWLLYGILLIAGVLGAISFRRAGDWVLRNTKRNRAS
jgi:hypothetical protein